MNSAHTPAQLALAPESAAHLNVPDSLPAPTALASQIAIAKKLAADVRHFAHNPGPALRKYLAYADESTDPGEIEDAVTLLQITLDRHIESARALRATSRRIDATKSHK